MQTPLSPLRKETHLHSHFLLHATQLMLQEQNRVQANAQESARFRADFNYIQL